MTVPAIRLFPPGIQCVLSAHPADAEALLPAELACTHGMAPGRLAQFRHGRACARRALAALGAPVTAIPAGDGRAPIWPAGFTGSITHAGERAAAAVARCSGYLAIGLDLEERGALDNEVLALICSADELQEAGKMTDPDTAARLLFSAKESVFKCLWPLLRSYVDFRDVRIRPGPAAGSWLAGPSQGRQGREDLRRALGNLQGQFELAPDFLVTGAWIRAG